MGNLWCNIRLFIWHIQIERGKLKPVLTRNDYWRGRWRKCWFEVCCWEPKERHVPRDQDEAN